MTRAGNDIGILVYKAGLGVGIPMGQAEDLARTAIYIAGSGGDLGPILAALSEEDAPVDIARSTGKLVVKSGRAAMIAPIVRDAFVTGVTRARLADEAHVPLVVAMLAEAGCAVRFNGPMIAKSDVTPPAAAGGPVTMSEETWHRLETLAAQTDTRATDDN